jgi:hypothetical protein
LACSGDRRDCLIRSSATATRWIASYFDCNVCVIQKPEDARKQLHRASQCVVEHTNAQKCASALPCPELMKGNATLKGFDLFFNRSILRESGVQSPYHILPTFAMRQPVESRRRRA